MSEYLRLVDQSANMEALRAARSYNDIVVVISRIKTATSSIYNKLSRKISNKPEAQQIAIHQGDPDEILIDRKSVKQILADIQSLSVFTYENQFARSLTDVIASDAKLDKFRRLLDSTERSLVKAQNLAYHYLSSIASRVAPKLLVSHTKEAQKTLSGILNYYKQSSFVVPTADDKTSYTQYLILHNVTTEQEYVLNKFIVAIHANNNYDNTYSYSLSFPDRVGEASDAEPFSSLKQLRAKLKAALVAAFNVTSVGSLGSTQRRTVEAMDNVASAYVEAGELRVELESGVTSSEINSVITRLLTIAHAALGVQDSRTDIVHRVSVGDKGNKIIRVALIDRNLYDMSAFDKLRKVLSLDAKSYKSIQEIVGDKK